MNRNDPQLGVFIRKHASAAALYCDVALLCVMSDELQQNLIEFEEDDEHNVKSLVVYFRKFSSSFKIFNQAVNFFRYLKANNAGLKRIQKSFGRHDVTHSYIMLRPALIGYWLKLMKGIPFVISEQWSGYATRKFSEKNFLTHFFYRWIFSKANGVTAVSDFLKTKMEAEGLKNNFIITPNVVEPMKKKKSPLTQNEKIKILTVADLVDEIKNISGTIKAIAKINKTNKEAELHIIGHGKDELMLKTLARELNLLGTIVFFYGVKTNEEVFQYLHATDFLVMNSRFETFSLICIEAMSCGKPVIATRSGGPNEFMNDTNGILIEPDNHEELVAAIKKMILTYQFFESEKLKKFALTHFSAMNVGEKFFKLYNRVLTP